MSKPDILVFMSDQHSPVYAGFGGNESVRTPRLDEIAENGTVFEAAYTSCPLCVPARVSMLTGQLPHKTGIFTNQGTIREDQATFLHSLVLEGYETVLCGRMHFIGKDQRHGFTRRIMGDITAMHWGVHDRMKEELGEFNGTLSVNGCHKVIGGGTSPVLEYDRAVIGAALDYLKEEHEKPQLIVVGTYAPHFSYVAPVELYRYYKGIADIPESLKHGTNYRHPALMHKEQQADDEKIKNIRAAYFGMITNLDRQIGAVHDAWKSYLETSNREGIFIYLSDHGDQIGERNLYGKQTFFEGSARIPLIFEGCGIQKGKRVKGAASIMDLGPTLCDIAGAAAPPAQNGQSLLQLISSETVDNPGRPVLCEYVERVNGRPVPCRMVRQGSWKLISYTSFDKDDLLFDLDEDPDELVNLANQYPERASELKKILEDGWEVTKIIEEFKIREDNYKILVKYGQMTGGDESERWTIPHGAAVLPEIV